MTHTPEWPEFDEACDPHLYPLVVLVEREQYNRARLCVNACAGKTNEQLEGAAGKLFTGSAIALWSNYCDLKEQNAALSEQVDILASALREIRKVYVPNGNLAKDIDAALAKAGSHE